MSLKINSEEHKLKEEIGNGGFDIVVYKLEKDNKYYVLKKILIIISTKKDISEFKEKVFLMNINNEYIVKYFYSFLEKEYFNILMEYAGNSNLKQFINSYKNKNCLIKEET